MPNRRFRPGPDRWSIAEVVEPLAWEPDPTTIGPLDGYQWLLFLAAHSARHTTQIEGIREHPGFPAVDSAPVRTTI